MNVRQVDNIQNACREVMAVFNCLNLSLHVVRVRDYRAIIELV